MSDQPIHNISLLMEHHAKLRQLAFFLVRGPDAQDLVQDTLVAALTHAAPAENQGAWLRRILRNRAVDRVRTDQRRQARESAAWAPDHHVRDAESIAFQEELRNGLRKALEDLDDLHREILIRRFVHDESSTEIAQTLQCSASTVRWRIHEGIARLREAMDAHFSGRMSWKAGLVACFELQQSEFESIDRSAHQSPSQRPPQTANATTKPLSQDVHFMSPQTALITASTLAAAMALGTGFLLHVLYPGIATTSRARWPRDYARP